MGKTFHHLKFTQRKKIKERLDIGIKKTEIAHSLGVHTATIYREIERGSVDGRYDPDYAENIYKRQLSEKGMQPLCIISPELAEYIAKLILDEGRSPAKIINMLQENPKYAVVPKSSATIYNAIDNGLIPGVTRENLNSDILNPPEHFPGCNPDHSPCRHTRDQKHWEIVPHLISLHDNHSNCELSEIMAYTARQAHSHHAENTALFQERHHRKA